MAPRLPETAQNIYKAAFTGDVVFRISMDEPRDVVLMESAAAVSDKISALNSNLPPVVEVSKLESGPISGIELGGLRSDNAVNLIDSIAAQHYEFIEQLGVGGFGEVWRCRHIESKNQFAVKTIRCTSGNRKDVERVERELKVFKRLSNPYIVKLHEVFREEDKLHMVMDLCSGGDLKQYLRDFWKHPDREWILGMLQVAPKGLPSEEVAKLMWQMLAGVAYLHHHRFMHRDIKLENCMLKSTAEDSTLSIVDFGLSTQFTRGEYLTEVKGTPAYMAPELIKGRYNETCDIWSIGIACYVLATGDIPWADGTTKECFDNICNNVRVVPLSPQTVAKQLIGLIEQMLTMDGDSRPGAKEVIANSRWLRKYAQNRHSGACCTVS